MAGEDAETALERHQAVVEGLLLLRLALRGADDGLDAEEDLARVGLAAQRGHAPLHVDVVGGRHLDRRLDAEDRLGVARREVTPRRRDTGLDDGGAILG